MNEDKETDSGEPKIYCAHCDCFGGKMYKRGKIYLCRDCWKDKIPDNCIGCKNWGCLEEGNCIWCTRNPDRVLKDHYQKGN